MVSDSVSLARSRRSAGVIVEPRDPLVIELETAYTAFRMQLAQLARHLGVDASSGTSIATTLGLNRQLAWQIATIAAEPSCSLGLNHLPGKRGLTLLIDASAKESSDPLLVERLRDAVEELERAVRRHAGDRASLGLITAAWETDRLEDRTEPLRREGHRAQCALLGVQVATQVRGIIFAPSRSNDPSKVSMASYQCFSKLMRLRRDRACRLLFIEAPTHDDGSPAMPVEKMAEHMREKFELDETLSSGTSDDIDIRTEGPRGWVTLQPGTLGRAAATTWCFSGCANYENPRHASERDRYNQVGIVTHVPTETMFIDVLMDRSLVEHVELSESLSVSCFDASTGLPMRPVSRDDPAYLFDVAERKPLGPTELACDTVVPIMTDLVHRAALRVGSHLDNLVGVRFKSTFAMSPTTFVITRQLPTASE